MTMPNQKPISLQAKVNLPRQATAGCRYFVSIDLDHDAKPEDWPYEREEYAIRCLLDTSTLFENEALGESWLILHRFGGTYGEVRYVLTASERPQEGTVNLILLGESGASLGTMALPTVEILAEAKQDGNTVELEQTSLPEPAQKPARKSPGRAPVKAGKLWNPEALKVPPNHGPWVPADSLICVVGSIEEPVSDLERALAYRLGGALARAGFGLVCGEHSGVASECAKGYWEYLEAVGENANRHLVNVLPPGLDHPTHGTVRTADSTRQRLAIQERLSDAAMVIGGDEGAVALGRAFLRSAKPLLPLKPSGGAAATLFGLPAWREALDAGMDETLLHSLDVSLENVPSVIDYVDRLLDWLKSHLLGKELDKSALGALTWLHLSDLQFGRSGQSILVSALLDDAAAVKKQIGPPDWIFVTGDVAYQGDPGEYALARDWLDKLAQTVGVDHEKVLIVPGNHDVDRRKAEVGEDLWDKLRVYADFARAFGPQDTALDAGKPWWVHPYASLLGEVYILGLNTALLSYDDQDEGRLVLGNSQLKAIQETPADSLLIILQHHPHTHLLDGGKLLAQLENRPHLLFCGPAHQSHGLAVGQSHMLFSLGVGGPSEHRYGWGRLTRNGLDCLPRCWNGRQKQYLADRDAFQHTDAQGIAHLPVPPKLQAWLTGLDDPLINDYLQALMEHCARLPIAPTEYVTAGDLNLRLPEIYVNLHATARQGADEPPAREGKIDALIASATYRFAVLAGGAGSGKTVFVNHFCQLLAEARLNGKTPNLETSLATGFPVRVALGDCIETVTSDREEPSAGLVWRLVEQAISHQLVSGATGISERLRKRLLREGIFFFDGLDEIPTAQTRRRVWEALAAFAKELAAGQARILVTTRSYALAELPSLDFRILDIAPLRPVQIEQFIESWCRAVQKTLQWNGVVAQAHGNNLSLAIWRDARFASLCSIPLFLTVIAFQDSRGPKLPQHRGEFYEAIVELLLSRWHQGQPGGYPMPSACLDSQQGNSLIRAGLQALAFQIHQSYAGKTHTLDLTRQKAWGLFAEILPKDCDAVAVVEFIEQRTGLLVRSGEERYRFAYFPFQEYLAACHLVDRYSDPAKELSQLLRQAFNEWREVFLLVLGRVSRGGRGQALAILPALVPGLHGKQPADADWRIALLVSSALQEMCVDESARNHPLAQKLSSTLSEWLRQLVVEGRLTPAERADAGDILGWLGDPRPGVAVDAKGLPDIAWVEIPAGSFRFGEEERQRPVTMEAFRIASYPVTVTQFQAFLEGGGYGEKAYWTQEGWEWRRRASQTQPAYWDDDTQKIYPNRPIVGVTWHEAVAFCRWLAQKTNRTISLPTEEQWEYAAKGAQGRRYPWGDGAWTEQLANCEASDIGHPVTVGMYPEGKTFEGVFDFAGNTKEWSLSLYQDALIRPSKERDDPEALGRRTARGCGWSSPEDALVCAYRQPFEPASGDLDMGFRIVSEVAAKPEPAQLPLPTTSQETVRKTGEAVPLDRGTKVLVTDEKGVVYMRTPATGALVGRFDETAQLDEAFHADNIAVLGITAPGGTGKSSIILEWLASLVRDNDRLPDSVYVWEFPEDGSSSNDFFVHLSNHFGLAESFPVSDIEKANWLFEQYENRNMVLVLDGIEALQKRDQGWQKEFCDGLIKQFLTLVASQTTGQARRLVIVASREPLTDLEGMPGYCPMPLDRLTKEESAVLLAELGVKGADTDLWNASEDYDGHALTLTLWGMLIAGKPVAHITKRYELSLFEDNRSEELYWDHAFRLLYYYEQHVAQPDEIILLRMTSLLHRPMSRAEKDFLTRMADFAKATENHSEMEWEYCYLRLENVGLLTPPREFPHQYRQYWDIHPFIREHFREKFRQEEPEHWRQANRVLFDYFAVQSGDYLPKTREELIPLYRAVHHGCRAHAYRASFDLYRARIMQGDDVAYSTNQLGATGEDASALRMFFQPETTELLHGVRVSLTSDEGAWLQARTAFCLAQLGRLQEAIGHRQNELQYRLQQMDSNSREALMNAAHAAAMLSELKLLVGKLGEAEQDARLAMEFAGHSGDWGQKMRSCCRLAAVKHMQGDFDNASRLFGEAVALQQYSEPKRPILYSDHGFLYRRFVLEHPRPSDFDTLLLEAEDALSVDRDFQPTHIWLALLPQLKPKTQLTD